VKNTTYLNAALICPKGQIKPGTVRFDLLGFDSVVYDRIETEGGVTTDWSYQEGLTSRLNEMFITLGLPMPTVVWVEDLGKFQTMFGFFSNLYPNMVFVDSSAKMATLIHECCHFLQELSVGNRKVLDLDLVEDIIEVPDFNDIHDQIEWCEESGIMYYLSPTEVISYTLSQGVSHYWDLEFVSCPTTYQILEDYAHTLCAEMLKHFGVTLAEWAEVLKVDV